MLKFIILTMMVCLVLMERSLQQNNLEASDQTVQISAILQNTFDAYDQAPQISVADAGILKLLTAETQSGAVTSTTSAVSGNTLYYSNTNFFNTYNSWEAQSNFDPCNRCRSFKYIAFFQGDGSGGTSNYLTAGASSLSFSTPSTPSNGPDPNQLFQAIQNVDGTWSFKASNGKYIRASNDLITVNYQTYIGPWERWYVERHFNHVHVESANFFQTFWVSSGGTLGLMQGGAGIMEAQWFPDINWLWDS